jgi:3-hydroxyisobutyrate dehydrogenase-like beta-hydroxyacid dehydrogenase
VSAPPATTLGVLHPGTMGTALAASALRTGTRVVWASEGRSPATAARAGNAGLSDLVTLARLCDESDVILSICPPANAEDVARDVARRGFTGLYVEANAISPERMVAIARELTAGGAGVVDGAVFGPPPWRPGTSRLYLAGEAAPRVAGLFAAGPVTPVAVDRPVGSSSALKMSYGAVQKGLTALQALSLSMADAYGVEDLLATEWDRSSPGTTDDVRRRIAVAGPKAWRWVGEMEEIADTATAVGLPEGFHRAAAELFEQWRSHKPPDGSRDAVVDDVLGLLRELSRNHRHVGTGTGSGPS